MTNQLPAPDSSNFGPQLPQRVFAGAARRHVTGPAAAATASEGGGITPAFLWRVFCQWWKWVVPAGLLLALIAAVVVLVTHVPKYEAVTLVKIESTQPFIAFEKGTIQGTGDPFVQTQIEMIRGPVVLAPLLQDPNVADIAEVKEHVDPMKFLQDRLSVTQIGKSELYRVAFVSRSAKDAATIANGIVAQYLSIQDDAEKQRSKLVIDVLDKEQTVRSQRVDELRKLVVELSKELTGHDPFGQGVITDANALFSASGLVNDMIKTDGDLTLLKARLQSEQNSPTLAADRAATSGLLDLEIAAREDVRQLEDHLAKLKGALRELRTMPRVRRGETWKDDPDYRRLEKEARETETSLAELKVQAGKDITLLKLEQAKAEQAQRITQLTQEIAALETKRQMLVAKFEEHKTDMAQGGSQSAKLEFAKSELEREQRVFELIASRKLALQTESRAPARVSLMQRAKAPALSMEPIPYKVLLLACLAALAAPFGLAIGHEFIVRRVSDADQLARESLLPVVGEVARLPVRRVQGSQPALAARQRDRYVYAESIDSLRTQLTLTENLGGPGAKVVAICSAASGEGKTSVATALAMSIAEATRRPTLIVDADLRDPDVSRYLAVPSQPGVAEVLSGKVDTGQAIHRVQNTQAFVMPAGKHRMNPHHLLRDSRIDTLLNDLRENFATIIIDTPPVLSASEALVYAKAADLVVFCSLADVSRVKQVRTAVERLQATGANVAGAVLSGLAVKRYVYHYGVYDRPE